MNKFRIGQKVRVLEPSEEHSSKYGYPIGIGQVGLIINYNADEIYHYVVKLEKTVFLKELVIDYFESELELVVGIGEQLLFDFMKE